MSVLERDFVMRAIKQLIEVLARLMKAKANGNYDEARQIIEDGCLSLLGVPYASLTLVDSASAAALLREPAKVATFGRLLEERGELHGARGEEGAASALAHHATEIYLEALERDAEHPAALEGLNRLRREIDRERLAEKYRARFDALA